MAKNEFLKKIQQQKAADIQKQRLFTMQWCADAAVLAANEVFQRKGDKVAEFTTKFFEYSQDIAKMTLEDAKSDKTIEYTKYRLDERLKEILGEHFMPWEERYRI